MGWPYRDLQLRLGVDPAVQDPPARKDERVRPLLVDDGQLEVPVVGSGRDRLPHSAFMPRGRKAVFDPDQIFGQVPP